MKKNFRKFCLFNRSFSSTDRTPLLNGNFVRASIEMKIVTLCHGVRYWTSLFLTRAMTFPHFTNKYTQGSLQQCLSSDLTGSVLEVKSHLAR